jgi:hypothetical protein
VAAAEMNARTEARGEPYVARDYQAQAPRAAEPSDPACEGCAVGIGIMTKDHARPAARKPAHGNQRVRVSCLVGEQPQSGITAMLAQTPGEQLLVHGTSI